MQNHGSVVKVASPATADKGKVRLGAQAPSLPARIAKTSAATADSGKVRLGAQAPNLPAQIAKISAATADSGKVRLGAQAPSLPARIVKGSATTADSGKVRLGAQAPSLPARIAKSSAATADSGKVRLGAQAPSSAGPDREGLGRHRGQRQGAAWCAGPEPPGPEVTSRRSGGQAHRRPGWTSSWSRIDLPRSSARRAPARRRVCVCLRHRLRFASGSAVPRQP